MRKILIATIISAFCASGALAQTTPPATTPPAAAPPAKTTPKAKATDKPKSAESIECSKQADAKGLHGKERKAFRATCKKDLLKKKA
jgi:hypothetical protein